MVQYLRWFWYLNYYLYFSSFQLKSRWGRWLWTREVFLSMLVDNDTLQRMHELTADLDAGKNRLEILMATHLQSRPYRAADLWTENAIFFLRNISKGNIIRHIQISNIITYIYSHVNIYKYKNLFTSRRHRHYQMLQIYRLNRYSHDLLKLQNVTTVSRDPYLIKDN